jgi:hypothetical protein
MGNATRGQISFKVDNTTYKMHFTANALCELEDASKMSSVQYLQELEASASNGNLMMTDVRLLFWAGLTENHSDLSIADAGRLITKLGGLEKAMAVLEKAVSAAMPSQKSGGKSTGKKPTGTA